MRYLFAFLLAAMVSPCWAKTDPLDSPEYWAANRRAAGERSAARIIASQMADQQAAETKEREATTRIIAIVIGAIICTGILGYAISQCGKRTTPQKSP